MDTEVVEDSSARNSSRGAAGKTITSVAIVGEWRAGA
jgi:hypothetical protein